MNDSSIHALAQELRATLTGYIEATYHISDGDLLKQRSDALADPGVIHQAPYLESTPRYQIGDAFEHIVGLHPAALEALITLSTRDERHRQVLYNPPYHHQAKALEHAAVARNNLVIMTGTGSGKTESFLMPVLAKLCEEAKDRPARFEQAAVRTMVLYPMNALVNDQLSRLRAIFGDPRIVAMFKSWAGRPARFARYTSRTPYAGIRTKESDQRSLKSFEKFYVDLAARAAAGETDARDLLADLMSRGKWPAKPDVVAWYGSGQWKDKAGRFRRATTLPDDAELITRDEVQQAPADVVVTNYSMLEYMLMRPVERGIFDQTADWLKSAPENRFTLVLDEAHLYRGAAGTEVGLLIRRLRDRLGVDNRQFQVICSTASFSNAQSAREFTAQLTDCDVVNVRSVEGKLAYRDVARPGTAAEAALLASIDLAEVHGEDELRRVNAVRPLLDLQGVSGADPLSALLHRALSEFGPLGHLVNLTMGTAQPTAELPSMLFPEVEPDLAGTATLVLSTLASLAKVDDDTASLLPARVHSFFRGLRGLWICMDPACNEASGAVAGRLYTQPRERCAYCNGLVLELYTCRYCGTAYARGYSPDPGNPSVLWVEPGNRLKFEQESAEPLQPVDLLLSPPLVPGPTEVRLDLITGEIDHTHPTVRTRLVYLSALPSRKKSADDDEDDDGTGRDVPGRFAKCGVCGESSHFTESPVQNHETKGDQPLQHLVSRQLQLQPASRKATKLAPLRGRKVLIFSDSRQVAARLAPVLQSFASKDAVRACLAAGWNHVAALGDRPSLQHLYAATLLGAHLLQVRLRPPREDNVPFDIFEKVGERVRRGEHTSASGMAEILRDVNDAARPPEALLADIVQAVQHGLTGLEALAVGSIGLREDCAAQVDKLPDLPGAATSTTQKIELCVAWLREWRRYGFNLNSMPGNWTAPGVDSDIKVRPRSAAFKRFVEMLPPQAQKRFRTDWIPWLTRTLCEPIGKKFRLDGSRLTLELGGEWMRCEVCKVPQRPCSAIGACLKCKSASIVALNPSTDPYFQRRKGFYRRPIMAAIEGRLDDIPLALIAAEHTAQLNAAQHEDVFSKGERNELLFQDVSVPADDGSGPLPAVDVLSSTTTMEVGIDIGQLSGVALRNMPPSRANYQQRAGRAGRRANALATVIAFSGSDTHDEHFFSKPAEMISGKVVDPRLSLDNEQIAERHLHAFLLQAYLQSKHLVPNAQLFSVLGTVAEFMDAGSPLNIHDLESFLTTHEAGLRARAEHIVPKEVPAKPRLHLLNGMIGTLLRDLRSALTGADEATPAVSWIPDFGPNADVPEEAEEDQPPSPASSSQMLLDRLLYKGVLPRYAFPTDVATFHVFDLLESSSYRARLKYSPSQGMTAALSQYAPGKELWIDSKMYRSGAIYSPMRADLWNAWAGKYLFAECWQCGHSDRSSLTGPLELRKATDCRACNGEGTLGPANYWFRPPGFAHRAQEPAGTRPDAIIPPSYATRANLTLRSSDAEGWESIIDPRIRVYPTWAQLLVSNTGPRHEGFEYCTRCGLIEASHSPTGIMAANHLKPYPDPKDERCPGFVSHNVVLGTDFYSDVALLSLSFGESVRLPPGGSVTVVALRTVAEALARAATETILEIESGEIVAEYRPALTEAGVRGEEAELFLYDTLPGGAGYSRLVAKSGRALLDAALERLERCQGNCDSSCYRCLRTFRNRPDHPQIDRHVGAALLGYLIHGAVPPFNPARMASAQDLLLRDLQRSAEGWTLTSAPDSYVEARRGTEERRIRIGHPLEVPDGHDITTTNRGEELVLNELLVRRNLPKAALRVREFLGIP